MRPHNAHQSTPTKSLTQLTALLILISLLLTASISLGFFGKSIGRNDRPPVQASQSLTEDTPTANGRIVFLGDSITYYNIWSVDFPEEEVYNEGIIGDTTGMVLDRLDETIALQPGTIFLMIGINDIHTGLPYEETLANVHQILARLRAECPQARIFVASVLPVSEAFEASKNIHNEDIANFNRQVSQIAPAFNAVYYDLWPIIAPEGVLTSQYSNDGLHINSDAYVLWAQRISQYLQ